MRNVLKQFFSVHEFYCMMFRFYTTLKTLQRLNTLSIMSQKRRTVQKKTHELKNPFQNIAHLFHFCSQMDTEFTIFEGLHLKNNKSQNLIFHWFQNIA